MSRRSAIAPDHAEAARKRLWSPHGRREAHAHPAERRDRLGDLAVAALALTACVATQSPSAIQPDAPGFLEGLWHGFIFPVAWVFSLFMDDISVYAVPNDGGWYDFGYFLGIVVFGVGANGARRHRR